MKKILILFLILAPGLFMASCVEKIGDDFDLNASARVQQAMDEAYAALISREKGWIMEYYPDPDIYYGGFLFLMKFTDDGYVIVTSEVANDPTKYERSTYSINASSGPVLTFDTFNDYFHFFSNPDSDVGDGLGSGYLGDFEFYIQGSSADKVSLRGIKTENYVHLVPFPVDREWDEYMAEFVANKISRMKAGYSSFYVEGNGTELLATRGYPIFSYIDPKHNDPNIMIELPYVYTINGIKFNQPHQLQNGPILDEFVWNELSGTYTSLDGSVVLKGELSDTYITYDDFMGSWRMTADQYTFSTPAWRTQSFNVTLSQGNIISDNVRLLEETIFPQIVGSGFSTFGNIHFNYDPASGTLSWPPEQLTGSSQGFPAYTFIMNQSTNFYPSLNSRYTLYSENIVGDDGTMRVEFNRSDSFSNQSFGMAVVVFDFATDDLKGLGETFLDASMVKQ